MSERNKRERKVSVRYRDYVDVPSEDEEPRKGGKGGYDKKFKGAGAAGGPSGLGGAGGPASAAAGPYAYESSTGEEKRMDATGRSVRWSGKPSQAMKERIARAMPGESFLGVLWLSVWFCETRGAGGADAAVLFCFSFSLTAPLNINNNPNRRRTAHVPARDPGGCACERAVGPLAAVFRAGQRQPG